MRFLCRSVLVGALAAVVLAAPASAAVVSNVDSPVTDTVFANPDLESGAPVETQQLHGTISGTAATSVDVFCVYGPTPYSDSTSVSGSTPLATLPVSGGEFSGGVALQDLAYYICRLIAVPAGEGPGAVGTYTGPVVSVGGFESYFDLGKQADLYQASSQREGYWDVYSAGHCLVQSSYPVKPTNLDYNKAVWGCTKIGTLDPADLAIDGAPALLPYNQDPSAPVMPGLQDVETAIDATGSMRVSESEPALVCTGPGSSCSTLADAGVRLDSAVTGSGNGSTLSVQNTWFNTSSAPKQITATYIFNISSTGSDTPGVRMPGESSYPSHPVGSPFSPVPGGIASALVVPDAGGTCTSVNDPCGSLTWARPPQAIQFGANHEPVFDYELTVPPNCGARVDLVYSQAITQAALDGMVAANEASLSGQPSLVCNPPAPPAPGPPAPQPPGHAKKCKKKKKKGKKRAADAKKKKCQRKKHRRR